MKLPLALALLVGTTATARAVAPSFQPPMQNVWVGAPASIAIGASRAFPMDGLQMILTLPTPNGLTLGTVQDDATKQIVDCTKVAGGVAGIYNVTCAVAGGLRIQVTDDNATPILVHVAYIANAAGSYPLTLGVACMNGCGAGLTAAGSITAADYPLTFTLDPPSQPIPAGGVATLTGALTNGGTLTANNSIITLTVPPNTAVRSVTIGGLDFTPMANWSGNSGGEAQLAGNLLSLRPVNSTLAPNTPFPFKINLDLTTAKANDTIVATVTADAKPAPAATTPIIRTSTINVIPGQAPTLALSKTADRPQARRGDHVLFTLLLRASDGKLAAGTTLADDLLGTAFSLSSLTLSLAGGPTLKVPCTGAPQSPDPRVEASCPAPGAGGPVRIKVAPGQTISGDLKATLDTTVRLTASASPLDNTASASDGTSNVTSETAHVKLEGTGGTGANLILAADRSVATRGDLVPLCAVIGAAETVNPILHLYLGPTLRPVDHTATILFEDGTPSATVTFREDSGELLVDFPKPLLAGQVATVALRTRVGVRAALGAQTISARLFESTGGQRDTASTTVRVDAEPDFDLCTVLGTVYRDDNGDGKRSPGEVGIEGATVIMDDGVTSVTDGDGRYHIAAVVPGQRAVKLAGHTLAPGARLTSDGTRILTLTPGALTVVDFGVAVPPPEVPPQSPTALPAALPELSLGDAGGLRYRLFGAAAPGARVFANGKPAKVDGDGIWSAEVTLTRGLNRVALVIARADGRVVIASRDVFWIERAEGGSAIVPRAEEPRLVLRFPPGALADTRFTLEGSVLPAGHLRRLSVAGAELSPDRDGRLRANLRLPEEAAAGVPIDVEFSDGVKARYQHLLETGGDFVFLVGLAEGKLSYVQSTAVGGPQGAGTRLGDTNLYAEGRVALYAKGKIKGRYLLEGGLDVDTSALNDWRDLFRGSDPTRVFRSLDPDRYYTVYGDASQTLQSAPTRGALYVRIAVDQSQLVLGNVQTGLTGVEFGRYSRSLTGGRLDLVLAGKTEGAPPSTRVIVFGAWLQTSRAHDELRGTGGSLYYLSHRTVVEGSAQVRVELRDALSDRPIENRTLTSGIDYEIDHLAGRIHLREPLSSLAAGNSLVRSGPLDGQRALLVADYEYIVNGQADDGAVGGRATQQLGPVRLGATFVSEIQKSYYLAGGDLQVDLGKYGVAVAEFAHSEGRQLAFARSDDGGLTYADALSPAPGPGLAQQGNAWKVEADLHAFGIAFRPYVRAVDRGFTDSAHAQDTGLLQYGAEAAADFLGLHLRLHYDERRFDTGVLGSQPLRRDGGGDIARAFGRLSLRLGARTEEVVDPNPLLAGHRTTLALRAGVDIVPQLNVYALGQYTVENGGGNGPTAQDASLGALGATVKLPWDIAATVEGSYGARGFGGLLSAKTSLGTPGRSLYGTYTITQDRDDRVASALAVGGRERLGQTRATLFAEDQFRDGRDALSGDQRRAHMQSVGADLPFGKRVNLGATFERGEVSGADLLSRTAGSLHANYTGDSLRLMLKGELRQDDHQGGPSLFQWLASGAATITPHKDLSFRARLLLSRTSDTTHTYEASAGLSFRPSFRDGTALLARYAYLDEQSPAVQSATVGAAFSERAHAASLAGEVRLFWRFSIGEKVAFKLRDDVAGQALLLLWINRIILHVTDRIDALAEYRYLAQPGAATRHGVAVEANYLLGGHFRLGAGYSFADFSDEELQLGRGQQQGVFVRAQGYY